MHQFGWRFIRKLVDTIYPRVCFVCGALTSTEKVMCNVCLSKLQPVGQEDRISELTQNEALDHAYCGWVFDHEIQRVIHSLKYEDYAKLGFELGKELVGLLNSEVFRDISGLIPIPLHSVKFRERGYNQAGWIAKGISYETQLPVFSKVVKRNRYTKTQTKLNAAERKQNLSQAFSIKKNVEDCQYILVDDVLTTGSTISSAARTLKDAGAKSITALTVSTPL